MTAASRRRGPAVLLPIVAAACLTACTGGGDPGHPATGPVSSGPARSPAAPAPGIRTTSRPPLPSSPAATALPPSPRSQLTPVSSAPDDLGRIDIRGGAPRRKQVTVTLPPGAAYTVTAGCIGRAGTLLRSSVVGLRAPNDGFLFGSTTPCNGRFVTDAALVDIGARTPALLEVTLDAGVEAATVVLRPAPTDAHL